MQHYIGSEKKLYEKMFFLEQDLKREQSK